MPLGGSGSFVAGGNIAPSRFVKPSSSTAIVVQAGAGDAVLGISGQGTRNPPYSTLDDGYHCINGENCRVYADDEVCLLEAGDVVAFGELLKSDTNGKGVPVSANNDFYGAQALEPASATGVLIKVKVVRGYYGA